MPISNLTMHFDIKIQLPSAVQMEHFDWLMDLWRVLAEWRSASMECGEQCVTLVGITMMPELCADNWDTVSAQVKLCIGTKIN